MIELGPKSIVTVNNVQMRVGLDISHYNDVINWPGLAAEGYQFVIIKSSQGYAYSDPLFKAHRENAIKIGMPQGAYHFYDYRYPDGTAQGSKMIQCVGEDPGNIAPCVDFETQYQSVKVSGKWKYKEIPKPSQSICYSELMELGYMLKREYGMKPKLYIGNLLKWLKPDAEMAELYDLWIAQWNPIVDVDLLAFGNWQIWQRTGDVPLYGQRGAWDINYIRESDFAAVTGQNAPIHTEPTTLTDKQKLDILWQHHLKTTQTA